MCSTGSKGTEDIRVYAICGFHRGPGDRYTTGHAQSCGGCWDHNQATDG